MVIGIIHIGKEANTIEEQTLNGGVSHIFRDKESEKERFIHVRQSDAERMGINRGTRWRWKGCIFADTYNPRGECEGRDLNPRTTSGADLESASFDQA